MKKGFTLIELLATIVLLGALVVISYPKVIELVEGKNKEIENDKLKLIYSAADTYINDNLDKYPKVLGNKYCFLISNLDKENLIPIDIGSYKTKAVNVKVGKTNSYSIIKNECGNLDSTPPVLTIGIISKTSNKITVKANATDPESEIIKYEFAIDSGSYVNNGAINAFTYSNLNSGSHTIKVRVTNDADITSESIMVASPNDITTPIYSISSTGWATVKTVTITYPTREVGYVYQYSTDNGAGWATLASGTVATVYFGKNGSVIARVYDGINYKTASTYTVSGVDSTAPSAPLIDITDVHLWAGESSYTIQVVAGSSDPESGILGYQYSIDGARSTFGPYGGAFAPGFAGPFHHDIYVRATNPVGLVSGWSNGIPIDAKWAFIIQGYKYCLGRIPSYAEVAYHYNSSIYPSTIIYNICASQESYNRNSTSELKVVAIYRAVLGRNAEQSGYNYHVNAINNSGFDVVLKSMVNSQEFQIISSKYGFPFTAV